MNQNFKKLFLLPSLLLTQAYCLENYDDFNSAINLDKYSEKIKINSETIEDSKIVSDKFLSKFTIEKNLQTEYILLSVISVSLLVLILKNKKIIDTIVFIIIFKLAIFLKIKVQKYVFEFIKSIKKNFHSNYQKIFHFSF